MSDKADQILQQVIELTSIEKFQGSSQASIDYFHQKHLGIRKKFKNIKIVTIAGTNGKGQVAYGLESLLFQSGLNVVKWSSPHLISICERISLNTHGINEGDLEALVAKLSGLAIQLKLSFYEFLFACFCEFVESLNQVDVMVLEVGLGGRLDTTNFFDADISAMTSVGLDHTEFLGTSLKQILLEKVEISRKGAKHYSGVNSSYLKQIEKEFIQKRGGIYFNLADASLNYFEQNNALVEQMFLELAGHNQKTNLIDWQKVKYGPGRLQKIPLAASELMLNSSHNLAGFKSFCQYIHSNDLVFDEVLIGFAERSIDDLMRIIELLKTYPCRFKNIQLTCFDHPRALPHSKAMKIAENNAIPFVNYEDFFATIKEEKKTLKALVTGSNYFLSEVYRQLSI